MAENNFLTAKNYTENVKKSTTFCCAVRYMFSNLFLAAFFVDTYKP